MHARNNGPGQFPQLGYGKLNSLAKPNRAFRYLILSASFK